MLLCFGSVLDHRCRLIVVKTKKWHMSCRRVCHWCFPTFWRLLCDLLLTRLMATWNLLVLYSEERGKSYIYIYLPRTTWMFEVRFVPLYKLQKLLFVPPSSSSSLSYLHTVYPKSFSTSFAKNKIIAKTFPNLRWQAMANFIKNSSKCGISKSSRTLIVSVSSLFLFIDSLR